MKLEYEKKITLVEKNACEYVENGLVLREDLMQIAFIPTNFNCENKYFLLRNNHKQWDLLTIQAEERFCLEWSRELGFNSHIMSVNLETKEISYIKDMYHSNPDLNVTNLGEI